MIDRTKYLQMCRDCAMLSVRNNVPENLRVVYMGVDYWPVSYTLAFAGNGATIHIATIHDMTANCVHDVLLKDIEMKVGDADGRN
jgi:hypothetical protein